MSTRIYYWSDVGGGGEGGGVRGCGGNNENPYVSKTTQHFSLLLSNTQTPPGGVFYGAIIIVFTSIIGFPGMKHTKIHSASPFRSSSALLKAVPSHFFPKDKFLQVEPIISGFYEYAGH